MDIFTVLLWGGWLVVMATPFAMLYLFFFGATDEDRARRKAVGLLHKACVRRRGRIARHGMRMDVTRADAWNELPWIAVDPTLLRDIAEKTPAANWYKLEIPCVEDITPPRCETQPWHYYHWYW